VGLDELTRVIGGPEPTVRRALGALRRAWSADQDARGRHGLGDGFPRMAFAHHEARPEHLRVRSVLEAPADRFGETARHAVLDGHEVVPRAEADPPEGAVRLTSTTGGRSPAHRTAAGKLLISGRLGTLEEVEAWIGGPPPERAAPWPPCAAAGPHASWQPPVHGATVSTTRRPIPGSTASPCPCSSPRRPPPPER
jgi:DNA-binding IclR family transcriptional regulator